MIRVAHVVASFDVGGLQKGVVSIVNNSRACQHLVISCGPGMGMASRLDRGDAESLGLASGQRGSVAEALADRLRSFGADVLHTRNWPTLVDGWRARRRAGTRSHVHGYHGRDASAAAGFGIKRRLVGRFLSRRLDGVVTLTDHMAREYLAEFGAPRGGLRVIANGVELPDPVSHARDADAPFTTLAVGRLDKVKDHESLICAFARMANRGSGDRLRIVGDGPEREALGRVCECEGVAANVELLGLVEDPSAAYFEADAFVQSSIYEGMSNTLAEAMAAGLPCVATRVGGNPDVLGDVGVLYEPGDVEALSRNLEQLKEDPEGATRLGRASRARAERCFGMDRMVQAYDELYTEVSGRS